MSVLANKVFKLSVAVSFLMASAQALAGEAETGMMQEFAKICDAPNYDYKTAESRFLDEGWSEADADIKEALSPNFYLSKVSSFQTFEVGLEDGGAWYGVNARGKLDKYKVNYCGFTVVAEDISGLREDVERYTERTKPSIQDIDGETRYVYAEDTDNEFYFVQEAKTDEDTYVFIVAKVMDGKRKKKLR